MASQKQTGIISSVSTAIFIMFVAPFLGEKFKTYEVFDVDNGNVIRVLDQFNKLIKVKLHKIKGSKNAQDDLAKKVLGKNVFLKISGKDEAGQTLAEVIYDKRNINLEMVSEGLAYNDSQDQKYIEAEKIAQKKKLGVWRNYQIANKKN